MRTGHILPEGGTQPRGGDQVPSVQHAQKAGGGGFGGELLLVHRAGRGRAGHAVPGPHARPPALPRGHEDTQFHIDERHEVQRHREYGDNDRESRRNSPGARAARRAGGDHREGLPRVQRRQDVPGYRRRRFEEDGRAGVRVRQAGEG